MGSEKLKRVSSVMFGKIWIRLKKIFKDLRKSHPKPASTQIKLTDDTIPGDGEDEVGEVPSSQEHHEQVEGALHELAPEHH